MDSDKIFVIRYLRDQLSGVHRDSAAVLENLTRVKSGFPQNHPIIPELENTTRKLLVNNMKSYMNAAARAYRSKLLRA